MKTKKITLVLLGTSLLCGATFAQEDDFSFDDFAGGETSSSAVEISGSVASDARAYLNDEDTESADELPVDGSVSANLGVKYSGSKADAQISFKLNNTTLLDYPQDIVDEAYASAYLGNFKLEAGKMKNVWGKGDKLHVIDNFNADDYTDFIIPDYLDRRISTLMFKGSYSFDYSNNLLSNMKFEAVYTPFMPVDRFSTSGRWTPSQVANLTASVTSIAKTYLAKTVSDLETARLESSTAQTLKSLGTTEATSALSGIVSQAVSDGKISVDSAKVAALMASGYTQEQATAAVASAAYSEYLEENLTSANTAYINALNQASALQNDSSVLYPDTNTLKYGQAGARFTASLGALDLGLSYYYGHYKQPSFNADKFSSFITKYMANEDLNDSDKFLAYDQKQTFGLEAATILWHFNLRGEFAYNLTEDVSGDDPYVHNNSIAWVGGFDIDLPIWNMNVNIQETGTYILNAENLSASDVDYNGNGVSNNKLVANITASFDNDKICPELTVMYGIEGGDLVVLPKLTVYPASGFALKMSGMYLWCRDDNSEFAAWKNNNFVQLGISLSF